MEWWPRRCRLTVALLLILLAVAHRDVLAGAAVPPGTGGVVGGVHTDPHRIGGAGASGDDDVVTQASAPAEGTHGRELARKNSGTASRGCEKKLRIAVPHKSGFKAFVNITHPNTERQKVTGYSIDIFKAAIGDATA
ncbi:unnamed protein product [Miscanthus lutarioriparius]|uniref:Uncharacterized protein n=1 Tax=Miscanthus lutarioriparius TaxID=422564 RepID=A0A811SFD4_9POAL|nr:unnamed protein product [Miscanthus lutarioriparius]